LVNFYHFGIFFTIFGIFLPFWYIFTIFGIFLPFWYVVARKIWQPCSGGYSFVSDFSKLVVTNTVGNSAKLEVLDLNQRPKNCSNLPDYPAARELKCQLMNFRKF
jgi:hypothetical protein